MRGVRGAPTPPAHSGAVLRPLPKGSSVAPGTRSGVRRVRGGGRGLIPAYAGVTPLLYPMACQVSRLVITGANAKRTRVVNAPELLTT